MMMPTVGDKYLITTDNWFLAPDGITYRAVFGTVTGVLSDKETLGITTNRGSTNWYVSIGSMLVAGCQIHYAIKTDSCSFSPVVRDVEHKGKVSFQPASSSMIFNADESEGDGL